MASFDYFKQQVSEMERIHAKTAHQEHIVQFRAMCDKKISDAIPKIREGIKQDLIQEMKSRFDLHEKEQDRKTPREKEEGIKVKVNVEDIAAKIKSAIMRAFR